MIGKRLQLFMVVLILITVGLRLWKLGSVPEGMTWDEVAIGYNGYSVWHIHRDEWLQFLPLSFRSFGDYKAPFAMYLSGFFTTLFGLSPLSVRLPFALAGIAAIVGIYALVKVLFDLFVSDYKIRSIASLCALLAALLLAASPWHVLFSRVGFESGLALTAVIWSTWLLFFSQKKSIQHVSWLSPTLFLSSALLFSLTPYIYHSAKVFTPVFVFFLVVFLIKKHIFSTRVAGGFLLTFLIGLLPLLYDIAFGHALERGGVTVFSHSDSLLQALQAVGAGYFAHLTPTFLLLGATDNLRHGTGIYGVLSLPHLLLLVLFCVLCVGAILKKIKIISSELSFLGSIWVLLGILPAAIGDILPHANRALLSLPGFILLVVWVVVMVFYWLQQRWTESKAHTLLFILVVVIALSEMLSLCFFATIYFGTYQKLNSEAYLSGYLEAARLAYAYSQGNSGLPEVDQVVFTSTYGQPYIFVLFANNLSTVAYHSGVLIKFLFPDQITIADLQRKNALVIAGEKDKLDAKPLKIISDQQGSPRFYVYKTEK